MMTASTGYHQVPCSPAPALPYSRAPLLRRAPLLPYVDVGSGGDKALFCSGSYIHRSRPRRSRRRSHSWAPILHVVVVEDDLVNLVHNGYPTFIGTAAPNIERR